MFIIVIIIIYRNHYTRGLLTGDVSDGFDGRDDVRDQHGDHGRAVKADREGLDPQKGDGRRALDLRRVDVFRAVEVREAGDHVPEQERQDHVAVLHEDAAEELDEDQEAQDGKPQADVLRGAVELARFAVGAGREGRAEADVLRDLRVGLPAHLGADDATTPVLHPGAGQSDPDENDGDRGHDGGEDRLQSLDGEDGQPQLQKCADHGGSEHGPVGGPPVHPVPLHLVDGDLEDGQKREGRPEDAEDARTEVEDPSEELFRHGDGQLENIDDGADSGGDQAGADGVLEKEGKRIRQKDDHRVAIC